MGRHTMPRLTGGAFLYGSDVLESPLLTPDRTWEARVEFVCGHCGAGALRIIGVTDKAVRVECLSCGKESTIERRAESLPVSKPPTESLPS